MVMDNCPVFDVSQIEEAITPAAVSINLFTRLLIQVFSALKSLFLFSELAALTAKSENKKKGCSTSQKARITRLPG